MFPGCNLGFLAFNRSNPCETGWTTGWIKCIRLCFQSRPRHPIQLHHNLLFISSLNNLAKEKKRERDKTKARDQLILYMIFMSCGWLAGCFSSCIFILPTAFLNYFLGSRILYFGLVSFKSEHGLEELRNGLKNGLLLDFFCICCFCCIQLSFNELHAN